MYLKHIIFHPEKYPTRDRFPFDIPAFHYQSRVCFNSPVTLFVGENGTGKSTLIEAIAHKCGIHLWKHCAGTRLEVNPYENRFHDYLSIEWMDGCVPGAFFGASIFQDFARMLEEWAAADPGQLRYFGGKSLLTQSHGQSIMTFFKARYSVKGLYLLDEPETALSPKSQIELIEVILKTSAAAGRAQFIIATHSPILLACPGAEIYSFDHSPIKPIRYEETGHYKIYRNLLEGGYRLLEKAERG